MDYLSRAYIDPKAQARIDALAKTEGIHDPLAGTIAFLAPYTSRVGNLAAAIASQLQNTRKTLSALETGEMPKLEAAKLLADQFIVNPVLTALMSKYLKPSASTETKILYKPGQDKIAARDVLYHSTTASNLFNILKKGLNIKGGSPIRGGFQKGFKGISLSRVVQPQSMAGRGAVLVIDPKKVKKAQPYAEVAYTKTIDDQLQPYFEYETRTAKPIPREAIKQILLNKEAFPDDLNWLEDIVNQLKKRKVPVKVYENTKDLLLDRIKSIYEP